jgi:hypothetical protein
MGKSEIGSKAPDPFGTAEIWLLRDVSRACSRQSEIFAVATARELCDEDALFPRGEITEGFATWMLCRISPSAQV